MPIAQPIHEDIQCQAERVNSYASDTPTTDKRCLLTARFKVNGKCYCLRHAEIASLHYLLSMTDLDFIEMLSRDTGGQS